MWTTLKLKFANLITNFRINWIKYWALQRRFAVDSSSMTLRRAVTIFISFLLVVYFVIGLPVLGYLVYFKHSDGIPLAIASTLYPFPVATVGGDTILLKPYSDRLNYLKFFAKQTQQPLAPENELRQQVVNKLVDEAVIRQWANKQGVVVTNEDIDAAYKKIVQDKGNEGDVRAVLSQLYNLNEKEFKRLIPDLLYREKIESTILVRAKVKHILVANEELGKKIRGEVDLNNFGDKAKQYSQDKTTRDSGGDLGTLSPESAEKISPDLSKAIFIDLQPGQISGPIKTQYGYHLVYLVERTGNQRISFEGWVAEKRSQTKIRKFLK